METFEGVAPLVNFECEKDEIKLTGNIRIRRLTKEEKNDFESNFDENSLFVIPEQLLSKTSHCIAIRDELPNKKEQAKVLRQEIGSIMLVLRLFQQGNYGIPYFHFIIPRERVKASEKSLPEVKCHTIIGYYISEFLSLHYTTEYHLSSASAERLREFCTKFSDGLSAAPNTDNRDIYLAIDRFMQSYARPITIDRVIDSITGFEALIVPEFDELAFRLANRASLLLGENDDERMEIFFLMKAAYRTRSKIVHGAEIPRYIEINEKSIDMKNLTFRVERLLARAIKTVVLLRGKYPRQDLINLLDSSLINSNSRGELDNLLAKYHKVIRTEE